jgi:CDP-4-dehydro-6-deoxyglucose reductase
MSFQVSVLPSGRQFNVESNESILAAGIRQGIALPYGCKDGACGSCKCKKLSGTVAHSSHQSKALSDDEKTQDFILTCSATAQSDLVLESHKVTNESSLPVKKMPMRVVGLEKKSHDVIVLKIQVPANDVMKFQAGQYIEILLRDGSRRSYSMANAPHTLELTPPTVELHIRHMPGGKFTDTVFMSMKEKDVLRGEGPFGSFYLRENSSKPIVLLASGTGFAPIKALIEHMQHSGIMRPATLYWGGRRPSDLYMDDWVQTKLAEMPNLKYIPVISNPEADDKWSGRVGFVHQAVLQDTPDLSGYQVYACGAPIVVESAKRDYFSKGNLPEEEFFADSFISAADK